MSDRAEMTAQDTVERVLGLSKADGCMVIADEKTSANLRWAGNTLTTNGAMRSRQLTVIASVGGATGVAAGVISRSNVTADELESVVRAAETAAVSSGPADDAFALVEPGGADTATGRRWDEPPAETDIAVFGTFAPALGEAFVRSRAAGRRLYGFAEHVTTSSYLGSSTGLRLRHDQRFGSVTVNGKSEPGGSAWVGAATDDFTDVDVAALDADLARRLDWGKRTIDLEPGRYETLLPPTAVADLMIPLYWYAGGRDAEEGHTVFSRAGGGTRLGEQLANVPVTLRSDPAATAAGLTCAPFALTHASGRTESVFDNGLPLAPTDWISNGVLATLIHTRSSAGQFGAGTAPPIGNLILDGQGQGRTLAEMIASTERGLLLTCLWYIREVDLETLLLTGLTRDGVYLVERGEVVGAVTNFRFNESPVDLLGRLGEVGRTEVTLPREWDEYGVRTAMPPIRIPDFNMSTVSQAS
ncbi:MAG: metallopeptidase TldD-related protein [Sporichthyaceae bacterium]|nr:metallopeptidase TldD-related protein [Sporichthyaceae bacterium]